MLRYLAGVLLLSACATSAAFQTPSFAPSTTNRAALLSQNRPVSSGTRALGLRLSMQAPDVVTKDVVAKDVVASKSMFVDEGSVLKANKFPLKPEVLIAKAKAFLESRDGLIPDAALLADDFVFMGPVVGPLSKDAFLSALGTVGTKTAFPDFQQQCYAFSVDPFDGRVWYSSSSS